MTLEDDIRRMAEARAAEVDDVPWRDRLGGGGGRRWGWIVAAAAAVVALVVGTVVVLAGDDDPADTEVAGDDGGDGEFVRWVPASGVTSIEYPGLFAFGNGLTSEVALLAADASVDQDDEWVTIRRAGPVRLGDGPDDSDPNVHQWRNEVIVDLPGEGQESDIEIRSNAIDVATFESRIDELAAAGPEVALLADLIADWDEGLQIVYVGPPAVVDASLSFAGGVAGRSPGDVDAVGWIRTGSNGQRVATYGPGTGFFVGLFALEDDGRLVVEDDYLAFAQDEAPRPVTEPEWDAIVGGLLGDDPSAELDTSGDIALAGPTVSAVEGPDGTWTVELRVAEPITLDPTGIEIRIGGHVTLSFQASEPDEPTTSLWVDSRMTRTEAERYAEAISAALDGDGADPTTTTVEPYPTVDPGACASEPPEGVPDTATHLDFNRTPLDLDLDGVNDELFTYEDDNADAWVIARTAQGWTTPAFIGPVLPRLVFTPDGFPAGADLDGDGGLEFFVTAAGNTARNVAMISTHATDCALVRVRSDKTVPDGSSDGLVLVGIGGNSCAPTGCFPRVRCDGTMLVVELAEPAPAGGEMIWSAVGYALADDVLVEQTSEESRFPPDQWPQDAPTEGDSDVVDCTPPSPPLGDQ